MLLKTIFAVDYLLHHWMIEDLWPLAGAQMKFLCDEIIHPTPMTYSNLPHRWYFLLSAPSTGFFGEISITQPVARFTT